MGSAAQSESGLPIQPLYDGWSLTDFDADAKLGAPGTFPYTRGVYPSMYTGRAVDDAAVRRIRHGEGVQRALPRAGRRRRRAA